MNVNTIKSIGELITYGDLDNKYFDIYYYSSGYPGDIHDEYGALAVQDFCNEIISKLESLDNDICRVCSAAFAIPHYDKNPAELYVDFKNRTYELKRRTVLIDSYVNVK